jgi:hypothetical protein
MKKLILILSTVLFAVINTYAQSTSDKKSIRKIEKYVKKIDRKFTQKSNYSDYIPSEDGTVVKLEVVNFKKKKPTKNELKKAVPAKAIVRYMEKDKMYEETYYLNKDGFVIKHTTVVYEYVGNNVYAIKAKGLTYFVKDVIIEDGKKYNTKKLVFFINGEHKTFNDDVVEAVIKDMRISMFIILKYVKGEEK